VEVNEPSPKKTSPENLKLKSLSYALSFLFLMSDSLFASAAAVVSIFVESNQLTCTLDG